MMHHHIPQISSGPSWEVLTLGNCDNFTLNAESFILSSPTHSLNLLSQQSEGLATWENSSINLRSNPPIPKNERDSVGDSGVFRFLTDSAWLKRLPKSKMTGKGFKDNKREGRKMFDL
ncbi:hypothetical protein Tco_1188227 [Tanacetum coccineum]